MKKAIAVFSIVFLIAAAAFASITLSAGSVQTHAQGGVTQETDDTGSVVAVDFQFQSNLLVYRLEFGTMNAGTFTPGPRSQAQALQIAVNLTTGEWRSLNGAPSGTLTGPQLLTAQNVAKNLRNGLENLSIAQNIAPGTQVPN